MKPKKRRSAYKIASDAWDKIESGQLTTFGAIIWALQTDRLQRRGKRK